MKDYNKVIISGRIVHKFETNKGSFIITINDGTKNFVKVFIADTHNISLIKNYNVNDNIEIEGNIQSTIRDDKKSVTIFCDRIYKCPQYDMRTKNEFIIQGTVKSISVLNHDCWRIVVATYVNNHYSVVPIIIYHPDVRLYPQEPDEKIFIRGVVQTVKKTNPETQQNFYYQNFVAK